MESFKNRELRNKWDHRSYWIVLFVLCVGLNLSGFLRAELLSPAKRSACDQITWQRENSVDCGDFYLTPDGEQNLYRLAGTIAVSFEEAADKEVVLNELIALNGLLSEYTYEVNDLGPIVMLKAQPEEDSTTLMLAMQATDTAEMAITLSGIRRASPVFVDPLSGLWRIPNGNIVIQLEQNVQPEMVFGEREVYHVPGTKRQYVFTLEEANSHDIFAEVNELTVRDGVEWAEPDFLAQSIVHEFTNEDEYYGQQWHLNNTGQSGGKVNADINATEAWKITTGSPNIVIAILDSGVQTDHPDLIENLFINNGDSDTNGIDDDENGYIDDVNGWDFYTDWFWPNWPNQRLPNYTNGINDPNPKTTYDNHGTSVAGVAVARGNNGIGVAGVAYTSKFLPIRTSREIGGGKIYSTQGLAAAIRYAAGIDEDGDYLWRGADILNCSTSMSSADINIRHALNAAATHGRNGKGCPIFCAAGNDASGWRGPIRLHFPEGAWPNITFRWKYIKDDSISDGDDTIWLDTIIFPDETKESFEQGLPTNWRTGGSARWTCVRNAVSGNHAMHGYDGGSQTIRAGAIGHNGSSWVEVTKSIPTSGGTLSFWVWPSSESEQKDPVTGETIKKGDGLRLIITVGDNEQKYFWISGSPSIQTIIGYPASHSDTIAVGSSTNFDYRADHSRYDGTEIDFLAPGGGGSVDIWTTDRTDPMNDNDKIGYENGDYVEKSGTSFASPLAAGVAALMLSKNPDLTYQDVRDIMRNTCDKIGSIPYGPINRRNDYYGYGRINAKKALDAVPTTPTTPSKATNPSPAHGATNQAINVSLNWSGGDGATSYDVYFGTDSTPDSGEFKRNQSGRTYNPGILQYNTTYYWRIDAKNSRVTTTGDVWKFTTRQDQSFITVTSPNGDENWLRGTRHSITWTTSGDVGSLVSIQLYKGGTFARWLAGPISTSDKSYAWDIPRDLDEGSNYTIRIASIPNPSIYDESDRSFSITAPSVDLDVYKLVIRSGDYYEYGDEIAVTVYIANRGIHASDDYVVSLLASTSRGSYGIHLDDSDRYASLPGGRSLDFSLYGEFPSNAESSGYFIGVKLTCPNDTNETNNILWSDEAVEYERGF